MSTIFPSPFNWSKMMADLADKGLYIHSDFLPKNLTQTFDQWYGQVRNQNLFKPAKIGVSHQSNLNTKIRSDFIYWIDSFPSELDFLTSFFSEFIKQVNSELFLSLKRYELHLSCYEPGSFYKTHIDRSQHHNQNRILTFILYLNQNWKNQDGGQLVVYTPDKHKQELIKVTPEFGTLVVFRSEMYPHEVLTANKERRALTGWFRND